MHSEKTDQDFKIMVFEIENNRTAISAASPAAVKNQTPLPENNNKRSMIYSSSSLPSPSSSTSLIKRGPHILQRRRSSISADSTCCAAPFAELAGGTTAECAAVCCCCPCGLAHLLYLTIYKVPAGLCRKALRRKRSKKLIEKGLLPPRTKRCYCDFDDIEIHLNPMTPDLKSSEEELSSEEDGEEEEAMMKLEEEMWETFYNAGFWRSPSQREQPKILIIESPKASKVVRKFNATHQSSHNGAIIKGVIYL